MMTWLPRGQRSGFLAGEEGFGLTAGGVDAQRTAEGELAGTRLVGLQMGLNQISQRLRERDRLQYFKTKLILYEMITCLLLLP